MKVALTGGLASAWLWTMSQLRYRLIYWPGLPGRGEFVRLVFEDAGIPYADVAKEPESAGGGAPAVLEFIKGRNPGDPHFAPPIVSDGENVVSQTPCLMAWLGRRHGLWPDSEPMRLRAGQLLMTLSDFVTEIHDTHHPLIHSAYYEEQREAAAVRARHFRQHRLPRFLGHLEDSLDVTGGKALVGHRTSSVDLAVFQILAGLQYAFPVAFSELSAALPRLTELQIQTASRPRLANYLASERRIPFNEQGIFRHYPELDAGG